MSARTSSAARYTSSVRERDALLVSFRRVLVGTLLAIPAVMAVTGVLLLTPQVVSLVATLVGIAALMSSETFHSKLAAGIGGVLAMGGVLAWALLETGLVH